MKIQRIGMLRFVWANDKLNVLQQRELALIEKEALAALGKKGFFFSNENNKLEYEMYAKMIEPKEWNDRMIEPKDWEKK